MNSKQKKIGALILGVCYMVYFLIVMPDSGAHATAAGSGGAGWTEKVFREDFGFSSAQTRMHSALNGWHKIGAFEAESGRLALCDPCYGSEEHLEDERLVSVVSQVKPGRWHVQTRIGDIGGWGARNRVLVAVHGDFDLEPEGAWILQETGIAVDSGQAGIFETGTLGDPRVVPDDPEAVDPVMVALGGRWYAMCCAATGVSLGAGVVPGGAVSCTGMGDGLSPGSLRRGPDGDVIAIRIEFYTEQESR
ncbi:MAG: hypothetical protein P1V35_09340 [Planctomycetota bacterium]|nr:hypothetical protein [Planctomycetota bacterium]